MFDEACKASCLLVRAIDGLSLASSSGCVQSVHSKMPRQVLKRPGLFRLSDQELYLRIASSALM